MMGDMPSARRRKLSAYARLAWSARRLVAVIAVLVCIVAAFAYLNARPQAQTDPAQAAYYTAQKAVEKALKAPATAQFSTPLVDRSAGYRTLGDGRYEAWGYVDSENSFGAMIRSEWRVVLRREGSVYAVLYMKVGDKTAGNYREATK